MNSVLTFNFETLACLLSCLRLFLFIYSAADTKRSVQMNCDKGNDFRMLCEFSTALTPQGFIFTRLRLI